MTDDKTPAQIRPYRQRMRKAAKVMTFGAAIMDTLMAGTKPPGVQIEFPTLHMAMEFRRRLYELRQAMDREKHPDFPITMSVRMSIDTWNKLTGAWNVWGKNPALDKHQRARVRLWPADSEFTEIVRHAGIRSRAEVVPAPPIDVDEAMSKFDDLIAGLKGDKS